MRLGQLSRKLAVKPADIVDFLGIQGIHIDDGSNTRIEPGHVDLILRKFAPELLQAPQESFSVEEDTSSAEQRPAGTFPADQSEIQDDFTADAQVDEQTADPAPIELIKAPKIELSGLKIVGKIELPETKKNEPVAEPPGEAAQDVPQREEPRPTSRGRERRQPVPRKNPVAMQREREALEAEKKRLARLEQEKQKRAAHYRKKVKEAPPTKRVRLVDEPVEEFSEEALKELPKTWWGKFMRWLNT